MMSYTEIARRTTIQFETLKPLRLFPSEYGDDDLFHMPIMIEGPANQGKFKTEVGRLVFKGKEAEIIYLVWGNGQRTSQVRAVPLDIENGCTKDHIASNRFAIAIANAIISYGTTLTRQLKERDNHLQNVTVILSTLLNQQKMKGLYEKISKYIKVKKLLGD